MRPKTRPFTYLQAVTTTLTALLIAISGCAIPPETDAADQQPAANVVGEFMMRVSPKEGRVTIIPISQMQDGTTSGILPKYATPGLMPVAFADVDLCQDGIQGSSDPAACGFAAGTPTVELADDSNSYIDTAGTGPQGSCPADSFCLDVSLQSFWPRPLSNVYVEFTSITNENGASMVGHNGTNSDPPPANCTASSNCPSNTYGLWQYTDALATSPGVMGAAIGGYTSISAPRTWVLDNPDDASTWIYIRVVSTTTYTNYALSTTSLPFVDACTGGTSLPATTAIQPVPIPFIFTMYGKTYNGSTATTAQQVNIAYRGVLTFGSAANTTSGTNVQLPKTSAPRNAIFAFWDNINYANGAAAKGVCYKSSGTAPNRQFAITWTNMRIPGVGGSSLTFTAVLREGSDRIDLLYKTMNGGTRAQGSEATVGAQNEAGTLAAGTYNQALYPSGAAQSLVPLP